MYEVLEEKKGLFKSSIKISVYETTDYIEYAENYLRLVVESLGFTPEFITSLDGEVIKIEMSTNHNSILIGKGGKTLLALNEIVQVAMNVKFKKRIRVLLDINNYKKDVYKRQDERNRMLLGSYLSLLPSSRYACLTVSSAIGNTSGCLMAVSYTHLDVYKRQDIRSHIGHIHRNDDSGNGNT